MSDRVVPYLQERIHPSDDISLYKAEDAAKQERFARGEQMRGTGIRTREHLREQGPQLSLKQCLLSSSNRYRFLLTGLLQDA